MPVDCTHADQLKCRTLVPISSLQFLDFPAKNSTSHTIKEMWFFSGLICNRRAPLNKKTWLQCQSDRKKKSHGIILVLFTSTETTLCVYATDYHEHSHNIFFCYFRITAAAKTLLTCFLAAWSASFASYFIIISHYKWISLGTFFIELLIFFKTSTF